MWSKVVQYIRTKFFRKPLDPKEAVDTMMNHYSLSIDEAAKNLSDSIDKDVLESIYKEVEAEVDEEIRKHMYFGHMPKIFVTPTATKAETIHLENGSTVIRVKQTITIR